MKSFNASKGKAADSGAGKSISVILYLHGSHLSLSYLADAIQTKPSAVANGAASMSQVAAQSAIKKPASDSLSPFSSDAEDEKPRKLNTKGP